MRHDHQRRRLLALSAAALASSTLALPGRSRAFTLEPMDPVTEELYRNACATRQDDYHAELIAEIVDMMRNDGLTTDQAAVREVLASVNCPLCGCRLDRVES